MYFLLIWMLDEPISKTDTHKVNPEEVGTVGLCFSPPIPSCTLRKA